MENTRGLDNESEQKLNEIKKRWTGKMKNVCQQCMYTAIRHMDRNMDPACDDKNYKEEEHPYRYDGDIYAYAGGDIKDLIDIITKLTSK